LFRAPNIAQNQIAKQSESENFLRKIAKRSEKIFAVLRIRVANLGPCLVRSKLGLWCVGPEDSNPWFSFKLKKNFEIFEVSYKLPLP
jgi:hypothetical protein